MAEDIANTCPSPRPHHDPRRDPHPSSREIEPEKEEADDDEPVNGRDNDSLPCLHDDETLVLADGMILPSFRDPHCGPIHV